MTAGLRCDCLQCGAEYYARGLCHSCYNRAYKTGALPPARDEPDDAAVWRLVECQPVYAERVDRIEAVQELTRRGYSAREIAARLRCTPRTVQRYRNAVHGAEWQDLAA